MNSLYQNCAEELEQGTEIEKRKLCWRFAKKKLKKIQTFWAVWSPPVKLEYLTTNSTQCKGNQLTLEDKNKDNSNGIVMAEYVPLCWNMNQNYCIEISKLRKRFWSKRPELWENGWIMHQGNAPAHNALSVWQFLAKKRVTLINLSLGVRNSAGTLAIPTELFRGVP
jgi:hypothetical protein